MNTLTTLYPGQPIQLHVLFFQVGWFLNTGLPHIIVTRTSLWLPSGGKKKHLLLCCACIANSFHFADCTREVLIERETWYQAIADNDVVRRTPAPTTQQHTLAKIATLIFFLNVGLHSSISAACITSAACLVLHSSQRSIHKIIHDKLLNCSHISYLPYERLLIFQSYTYIVLTVAHLYILTQNIGTDDAVSHTLTVAQMTRCHTHWQRSIFAAKFHSDCSFPICYRY